jgi:hypothetical protein
VPGTPDGPRLKATGFLQPVRERKTDLQHARDGVTRMPETSDDTIIKTARG